MRVTGEKHARHANFTVGRYLNIAVIPTHEFDAMIKSCMRCRWGCQRVSGNPCQIFGRHYCFGLHRNGCCSLAENQHAKNCRTWSRCGRYDAFSWAFVCSEKRDMLFVQQGKQYALPGRLWYVSTSLFIVIHANHTKKWFQVYSRLPVPASNLSSTQRHISVEVISFAKLLSLSELWRFCWTWLGYHQAFSWTMQRQGWTVSDYPGWLLYTMPLVFCLSCHPIFCGVLCLSQVWSPLSFWVEGITFEHESICPIIPNSSKSLIGSWCEFIVFDMSLGMLISFAPQIYCYSNELLEETWRAGHVLKTSDWKIQIYKPLTSIKLVCNSLFIENLVILVTNKVSLYQIYG